VPYDVEETITDALQVIDCQVERLSRYDEELECHELDFIFTDDNHEEAQVFLSELLSTMRGIITGIVFDYCDVGESVEALIEEVFLILHPSLTT
jgi:hypothetical protein